MDSRWFYKKSYVLIQQFRESRFVEFEFFEFECVEFREQFEFVRVEFIEQFEWIGVGIRIWVEFIWIEFIWDEFVGIVVGVYSGLHLLL